MHPFVGATSTLLCGVPGSLVGNRRTLPEVPLTHLFPRPSEYRRDALRTNLWLVPTIEVLGAGLLFAATYRIDRQAYNGRLQLPAWTDNGSSDAARQILIGIAAAVITVVGLVFSITIVALTLASTQFGPRMLRNFVRDRGTQITLGTFVGTFVFAVLALSSISHGDKGDFVPHLSITVSLGLLLVALSVLIYFIHHVATMIQLPRVIASIASDLAAAIEAETGGRPAKTPSTELGPSVAEIETRLATNGVSIPASSSGYLQFVAYDRLVNIATRSEGVMRLLHRPGHFVVQGLPLAVVWPPETAPRFLHHLERAHVTGPHRTLTQDLAFAIDQLVEIAIRALSPAVNDTFTAIACIDWLSDTICKITTRWDPPIVHRDRLGNIRVLAAEIRLERFVERAFDQIRQSGRGMPAILIRQLDGLERIARYTSTEEHRTTLIAQADMILRNSTESIPEPSDRADVQHHYDTFLAAANGLGQRNPDPLTGTP